MRRLFTLSLLLSSLALAAPALAAGGSEGEHGHAPSFHDINWFYGMIGEKEGVEPGLLFRPTGMPAPFGALLLNTAILYFILYRLFKKPLTEGLASRKAGILKGMEEAARMKREAEQQLAGYEAKLAGIDEEVARIHREMRAAGEAERARVLAEARERRTRMERDAHQLVEAELNAAREQLLRETVSNALSSAERILRQRIGPAEQRALAERHLSELNGAAQALRGHV